MDATLNGPFGPVSLSSSELTIGRAPDNKLIINDVKASSHHAHIRFSDGTYRITDLGSTNGTFVNGQRLVRNMSRTLLNGDTIRIGDAPLSFTSNDGLQIGSTVYAPPSDNNLMPATAAASEPLPVYQQSQVPPVPPVLSPPHTPQGLPGSSTPASVPSLPPLPPSYAPVLPRKKSRRGLWITLAIVAAVLILVGAIAAIVNSATTVATPTPAQTLDAFCNALKSSDDHTAYMQFSPALQSRVSEISLHARFATPAGLLLLLYISFYKWQFRYSSGYSHFVWAGASAASTCNSGSGQ